MSNPIFDMMNRRAAPAPCGNLLQNLMSFARTVQGNPEQIVRGLIDSGRMSPQQFEQLSQTARQFLRK